MGADGTGGGLADREAFAQRLRLQLRARYRGASVEVDSAAFVLQVTAPGVAVALPLSPLQHSCQRDPDRTPSLIAAFVNSVERQLVPSPAEHLDPTRLLWCVRPLAYMDGLGRAGELLTTDVGAGMVAFVAEALPGLVMRGLSWPRWEARGHREGEIRRSAEANTAARFAGLAARIDIGEAPRAEGAPSAGGGWRFAGDVLFQGSMLLVPGVLRALADRARGEVLLGVPDRSLVLAAPAIAPAAAGFDRRVLREWREALNPCSRDLLVTDGSGLRPVARRRPGVSSRRSPSN